MDDWREAKQIQRHIELRPYEDGRAKSGTLGTVGVEKKRRKETLLVGQREADRDQRQMIGMGSALRRCEERPWRNVCARCFLRVMGSGRRTSAASSCTLSAELMRFFLDHLSLIDWDVAGVSFVGLFHLFVEPATLLCTQKKSGRKETPSWVPVRTADIASPSVLQHSGACCDSIS